MVVCEVRTANISTSSDTCNHHHAMQMAKQLVSRHPAMDFCPRTRLTTDQ